jgi:hypothetical protein
MTTTKGERLTRAAAHRAGHWSRLSIQRDRERWEAKCAAPDAGDPFPVGLTPEETDSAVVPGDWEGFEPNTWGGS